MKKYYSLMIMAVATLLTACQEKETPVPIQVEVVSQVKVIGNRANIVKPDTTHLVIVRDSVAD